MFQSHLDAAHVASVPHLPAVWPGMGAVSPQLADASDPTASQPQVPAPIAPAGVSLKQVLLVGGVAVVVFLLLRHFAKKRA